MTTMGRVLVSALAGIAVLGCQTTEPPPPAPPPPPVAAAPAPAPAPIRVLPFDEAVVAAASTLLAGAAKESNERRVVVIDPLIDAVSGMESQQTRLMEKRIVDLVKEKYPQFEVQPFNVASVASLPIVLVGTFTPIDSKNQVRTTREQFRICLALADLSSGKILSKGVARSQLDGIDSTPTSFYRDSVVWSGEDPAISGYVKTCSRKRSRSPARFSSSVGESNNQIVVGLRSAASASALTTRVGSLHRLIWISARDSTPQASVAAKTAAAQSNSVVSPCGVTALVQLKDGSAREAGTREHRAARR